MSLRHLMTRAVVVVAIAGPTVPGVAAAGLQEGGDSARDAEAFRVRLARSLAAGDRASVAALVRYPIRLEVSGLPVPVQDAAGLLPLYDQIFTRDLRCALEQARLDGDGTPAPSQAVRWGSDVISVRAGALVAQRGADGFLITRLAITSLAGPRARPGPVAVDARAPRVRRFTGSLAEDDVRVYVLSLTKGATLQATLERFPGLAASLRLRNAKGEPVNAGADGRRAWTGVVPESGQYRLDVVRRLPYCDPPFDYLLRLRVR